MALISGNTIIRSLALFHIAIGFFFLTSPKTIADQSLVFILGEAMKLPGARAFDVQSAPLAFLGMVLALFGISDLVSVSMPEEVARYHWGSQAPIRFALFFALTAYTLLFSRSSPLYKSTRYVPSQWGGEGLKNQVVFTWAFLELVTWFWIFVTLSEERKEAALQAAKKRASQEQDETM